MFCITLTEITFFDFDYIGAAVPILRQHLPSPCTASFQAPQSMHFGDVSETNGWETPRQSRSAHA